jgi:hypothetical protein
VGFIRILVVPLVAAFVAALFAHVAIDVAGDYLLPHDAYDDVAHGSRALVLGIVSAISAALAMGALAAAVREARGSLDAFGRALRSSIQCDLWAGIGITSLLALGILVAMECVDVRAAGRAIDDVGDLFGGSLALGATTVALFSLFFAVVSRALVRVLAGAGQVLVCVLATVFAAPHGTAQTTFRSHVRATPSLWLSRLFGVALSGRAPPL